MSRKQFEEFYESVGGCLLSTVKELHWRTWMAAQDALLSAHGPVTMLTMAEVVQIPFVDLGGGYQRANADAFFKEREQQIIEDELRDAKTSS